VGEHLEALRMRERLFDQGLSWLFLLIFHAEVSRKSAPREKASFLLPWRRWYGYRLRETHQSSSSE
jgi:hypothetical protein